MKPDVLVSQIRVREAALDGARRDLAHALEQEESAEAERRGAATAILCQSDLAASSKTDAEVESFACWLKCARLRMQEATCRLEYAQQRSAACRAALTLARAAAETAAASLACKQKERRQAELPAD